MSLGRTDTAAYYDRLSRWTAVARWFGYGGGHDVHTVHRALRDPRAEGRPTPTRIHDLIADLLPPTEPLRVLDAGCGQGGTLIDLAGRIGGATGLGVTLSETQAARARQAIAARGLTDRIGIQVTSYDTPPPGPYDVIVAIESLAHSPSPVDSVRRLAAQLAPGGQLIIVDDMPSEAARRTAELTAFMRGWQCPVLASRVELGRAFAGCGLTVTVDRDLSAAVVPRSLARLRFLERVNRVARLAVPWPAWRAVMESYLGGLALERLYRAELVQYCLLVGQRPAWDTAAGDRSGEDDEGHTTKARG